MRNKTDKGFEIGFLDLVLILACVRGILILMAHA